MIITFCGHGDYQRSEKDAERLLAFLEETVGDAPAEMFLGGYGNFDRFAYECCRQYRKTHPQVSLVLVTPYMTREMQKKDFGDAFESYDAVVYPPIEDKPLRFAISYRNRYMAEQADYVVSYVTRHFGGAYTTYQHAEKRNKAIFRLAGFGEN